MIRVLHEHSWRFWMGLGLQQRPQYLPRWPLAHIPWQWQQSPTGTLRLPSRTVLAVGQARRSSKDTETNVA